MFPFQQSCELSFKIRDEGDQNNEITNLEDQIMLENNSLLGFNNNINNVSINPERGRGRGQGRGRRSSSSLAGSSSTNNTIANNDEVEKRILHREYERLRRQEMANLFNSLRQTLPVELIQGKRSISDDVGEAINYIQDLKKKVKELKEKRDQLRQSVESPSSSGNDAGLRDQSCVVIRQSLVGLEIEISVGFEHKEFLLSTALQLVIDEDLEVVTCTSTKFNEKLVHILQCQQDAGKMKG
ncbi:transcription factor bHLH126-like isoform X2 [Amaranthus tricolor]|uniref:transcription factor bHLH126-like isoform X2 n=1 Tax=Amaranthus tricolor TaxID=29722 RepID=UPI00258F8E8A|nr:transcription factor bHLH126-like isoform X2 [Amaranthus tricolor]